MPTKTEAALRRFSWDLARRAERTREIKEPAVEAALSEHIAGRYESAIAAITAIPEAERKAGAWRVLGHAEHGRGEYDAALAAHLRSFRLHEESDPEAASDDQVNMAAVFISMKRYDDAWAATEKAEQLAPDSPSPWLPRISLLNLQGRRNDLEDNLRKLISEQPDFVSSSRFRDHLEQDADFIGVSEMIAQIGR
ncbi:tetratricopeptide repeat protein [Bradyrhizobium diazoefficiens]|uniref:tetratricopeptide repeat protein n=1 Tax=Bradyrhizobium diazoefficiens TaxID=1355477 RepID=UPI0027146A7B|nr:tetratricopeptide repeat protein [Bradyrhizobium diazoefficiens]WLC16637.1 tetratricopeptide repeat protein [Bradyrhizobium diazoefficiens]